MLRKTEAAALEFDGTEHEQQIPKIVRCAIFNEIEKAIRRPKLKALRPRQTHHPVGWLPVYGNHAPIENDVYADIIVSNAGTLDLDETHLFPRGMAVLLIPDVARKIRAQWTCGFLNLYHVAELGLEFTLQP